MAGRNPKGDHVGEGVELDTDGRLRLGQAGDPTVDPVEEQREDDEKRGAIEIIARRVVGEDQDRVVTAQHTRECEEVGKYEEALLEVDFHARLDSFR